MNYEYRLMYNAGFVTVSQNSGRTVALQYDKENWEHKRWAGFIELKEARQKLCKTAFIACFRGVCMYRKEDPINMIPWQDPPKNHSLAGFVEGNSVRGIMECRRPWFVDFYNIPYFVKDPNYEPPKMQKVFSLAHYRRS